MVLSTGPEQAHVLVLPPGLDGCGLLHHELADVAVNFRPLRIGLQRRALAIVACP